MKEFVEKLIARLEEYQEIYRVMADACKEILPRNFYFGRMYSFADAILIVNQVAEEYNGGWIPCSERLPELTEGTECFKQSPVCLTTLKWWDGDMTESIGWYNQSGVWNEDSNNCKVIAWQPLPEPYKGE